MDEARGASMRNVALVSNAGAGKTSLSEALLYVGGAIPALGTIAKGTTVSDFEPEELRHLTSTSTSLLQFTWNHLHISLIDPPGALDLLGESLAGIRAVDAVVLVLSGRTAPRAELMRLWKRISDEDLPCLIFLNGVDKDGTDLAHAVNSCRTHFGVIPIPMAIPVDPGAYCAGVLDVRLGKLIRSGPASPHCEHSPIPPQLEPDVQEAYTHVLEAVAENDETLLEMYLAEERLGHEELRQGLRSAIRSRQLFPMYTGSATQNVGVWSLLDAIDALLPSPSERGTAHPWHGLRSGPMTGDERKGTVDEPFSAYVFKTVIDPFVGRLSYCRVWSGTVQADSMMFNSSRQTREKLGHFYKVLGKRYIPVGSASAGEIIAIGKLKETQTGDTLCQEQHPICYPGLRLPTPILSYAVEAKSHAEIDKVSLGLHKLMEEDPTLEFVRNTETKEMVLRGMGQFHLTLALEKLHRKFGAEVVVHSPKIPYRETLTTASHAQGKYKKQTGGHGQYGDCWLELTPLSRGQGFIFENRIVGGVIPRNFIPAVEKGVIEAMHEGPVGHFPVVDIRVAVYDGSYHTVDSSEMSFKIAASLAFKQAMEAAHPILLEPVMTVEIEAPTETVGAVIGDVNGRRGRILSVIAQDHTEQIRCLVPLAELLTYATTLNALTGGRGTYAMDLTQYDEVPKELVLKILERQRTTGPVGASH